MVEGNYIGADTTGATALGNGGAGILIASGAQSNTIGGTASGAGNVIGSNGGDGVLINGSGTNGNVVEGNYIGTDSTGTVVLLNGGNSVEIDSGVTATVSGPITGGILLSGGTLTNSTIDANATLTTTGGGTLSNSAVEGTINLSAATGAALTVTNGLELDGIINIGADSGSNYGVLTFSGSQTITGSGSIDFGSSTANQLLVNNGTVDFVVAIHGDNGSVSATNSGTFDSFATLATDVSGGTLTVNLPTPWTNYGHLEALNGGTLDLVSAWNNGSASTPFEDSDSTINIESNPERNGQFELPLA